MHLAQSEVYPRAGEIWVMYDIRDGAAHARLHRERVAWRDRARIEAIDTDRRVLIIQPGVTAR